MLSKAKKESLSLLDNDIKELERVAHLFGQESWRVHSLHTNNFDQEKMKDGARSLLRILVNYI